MTIAVAVNLLWCTPGRVGGSEEYLVRQLTGLDEAGCDVAPTLCCAAEFAAAHPRLATRFAVRSPGRLAGRRWARIVIEQTWLARRSSGFDLVHHGGGTAPLVGPRPILLTVHDLQYRELPHNFSAARLRYLRWMMPRSVRRAAVVATPSEFVRGTVIEAFGVAADRVVVVPHGVGRAPTATTETGATGLRQRYGLGDGPYVVYPAVTHPHKNHRLLLDVMARHWTDPALRLVLLGGPGASDADVARAIAELGIGERVVRPGRVPDSDRDALIAGAAALVFPSRYEGFGAPLIEAMALGTPVICGDHPAMREVVDSAAVVRADDVDAWAGALDEVGRRRSELVAAGRDRAAHYTLAISGTALAEAYQRALG